MGMETIAWYRYEGTVDTEGIGIEMERLAARQMSHNTAMHCYYPILGPLIGH